MQSPFVTSGQEGGCIGYWHSGPFLCFLAHCELRFRILHLNCRTCVGHRSLACWGGSVLSPAAVGHWLVACCGGSVVPTACGVWRRVAAGIDPESPHCSSTSVQIDPANDLVEQELLPSVRDLRVAFGRAASRRVACRLLSSNSRRLFAL